MLEIATHTQCVCVCVCVCGNELITNKAAKFDQQISTHIHFIIIFVYFIVI